MNLKRANDRIDPKRCVRLAAAAIGLALPWVAGGAQDGQVAGNTRALSSASQEQARMWMTIGTQRFAVTLEDNPTARAFAQLLPATFEMADLNGNEKHASLPRVLPTNAVRPGTIRTGDVLLYGNNTLVVFYETFASSYSYTRIGRVQESSGLGRALGPISQQVTFSAP